MQEKCKFSLISRLSIQSGKIIYILSWILPWENPSTGHTTHKSGRTKRLLFKDKMQNAFYNCLSQTHANLAWNLSPADKSSPSYGQNTFHYLLPPIQGLGRGYKTSWNCTSSAEQKKRFLIFFGLTNHCGWFFECFQTCLILAISGKNLNWTGSQDMLATIKGLALIHVPIFCHFQRQQVYMDNWTDCGSLHIIDDERCWPIIGSAVCRL